MSFTARVKDELSRIISSEPASAYAELSAIVRVCGSLSFHGSGRWSLRVTTETGAVARIMIKLCHDLFDLATPLTVRRSNLHKTHNYLIEIKDQENLEKALAKLGIIAAGSGLVRGLPPRLLQSENAKVSYLRGAFMAGGFVSDPRGDFHLEISLASETIAEGLLDLSSELGIDMRLNNRRGAYVIYLKSSDGVVSLLSLMGAKKCAATVAQVRLNKIRINEVNRRVNAEFANQARASDAAASQAYIVARAEKEIGLKNLSPALREFCVLRRLHPEFSLAALGKLCTPAVSKSAMHHRFLRLEEMLQRASTKKEQVSKKGASL